MGNARSPRLIYSIFLSKGTESNLCLFLTRRIDESLNIGDSITITVLSIEGDKVKLGIKAPREVTILRQEIFQAVQEQTRLEQRLANGPEPDTFKGLRELLASIKSTIPMGKIRNLVIKLAKVSLLSNNLSEWNSPNSHHHSGFDIFNPDDSTHNIEWVVIMQDDSGLEYISG